MMNIQCTDKSDGRLIFALSVLKSLTASELRPELVFDSATSNGYKELVKYIPGVQWNNEAVCTTRLIFSDLKNLETALHDADTLIFPILEQDELQAFARLWTGTKYSAQLIPISTTGPVFMPDAVSVLDYFRRAAGSPVLKNKRILISAGPTIEDIDPVRFLTNRSTGKMGIALARAAFVLGAEVELVCGPTCEKIPDYLNCTRIRSAAEMAEAIIGKFKNCDVYLGSAAVADFTPVNYHNQKIKKNDGHFELPLRRTRDILSELAEIKREQVVVGFSVETNNEIENSRIKLEKKNLDLIVINNPLENGAAFAADTNHVTLLGRDGGHIKLPLLSKFEVGLKIFEYIIKHGNRP